MWNVVDEGSKIYHTTKDFKGTEKWAKKIDDWMADSNQLFLSYCVEHTALAINLMRFDLGSRVPYFAVELAEREAMYSFEN